MGLELRGRRPDTLLALFSVYCCRKIYKKKENTIILYKEVLAVTIANH